MRRGDFNTFVEALDYAAEAESGANFYGPRGDLTHAIPYAELVDQCRLIGARLLAAGMEPGERVGIVADTSPDFVLAFTGSLYAGLIPCPMPLPKAFGEQNVYAKQISRISSVANVSTVIVPDNFVEMAGADINISELKFYGSLDGLPATDVPLVGGTVDPNSLAYLQFSSGTTSAPKGIAVTNRALMANIEAMSTHALGITAEDRGFSWLPFYHDMGLVGNMLLPIANQLSASFLATSDFVRRPALWPKLMSETGGTMCYSPSFGYNLAARAAARLKEPLDLTAWRLAGVGGDAIKPSDLASFSQAYEPHGFDDSGFLPSYGMAELTLGMTFTQQGQGWSSVSVDSTALEAGDAVPANGHASATFVLCGKPLPKHQIQIRSTQDDVLDKGKCGRVMAHGPSMMLGYYNDSQLTQQSLSEDGWLDTGDRGFMTDDGELVITGRIKDLIILNGRNIWPQDIEWNLEKAFEGRLREGSFAAFNIDLDGEERVVVAAECREQDKDKREALREEVRRSVKRSNALEPIVALAGRGQLPRTSSGAAPKSDGPTSTELSIDAAHCRSDGCDGLSRRARPASLCRSWAHHPRSCAER